MGLPASGSIGYASIVLLRLVVVLGWSPATYCKEACMAAVGEMGFSTCRGNLELLLPITACATSVPLRASTPWIGATKAGLPSTCAYAFTRPPAMGGLRLRAVLHATVPEDLSWATAPTDPEDVSWATAPTSPALMGGWRLSCPRAAATFPLRGGLLSFPRVATTFPT